MSNPTAVPSSAVPGENQEQWVVLYRPYGWWKHSRGGYTPELLRAGIYSRNEALKIEATSDRGDAAFPLAQALKDRYINDLLEEPTVIRSLVSRSRALHAEQERLKQVMALFEAPGTQLRPAYTRGFISLEDGLTGESYCETTARECIERALADRKTWCVACGEAGLPQHGHDIPAAFNISQRPCENAAVPLSGDPRE
jgi:hypothetical protein